MAEDSRYVMHIHERLMQATQEAAHWKAVAANLSDIVDATFDEDSLPKVRRIIMQRREIKAAWQTSNMYQRWWLREKEENERLKVQLSAAMLTLANLSAQVEVTDGR